MRKRLKLIRNTLKLNQKEFGEKIQCSYVHVSDMERGRHIITEKTIKKIVDVFSVSEEWLRTGFGEMFVEIERPILEKKEIAIEYIIDLIGTLPENKQKEILDFIRGIVNQYDEEKKNSDDAGAGDLEFLHRRAG